MKKTEMTKYKWEDYIETLTKSILEDIHYLAVPNIYKMENCFNEILQKIAKGKSLRKFEITFVDKLLQLRGRSDIVDALQKEISKQYFLSSLVVLKDTLSNSKKSSNAGLVGLAASLHSLNKINGNILEAFDL